MKLPCCKCRKAKSESDLEICPECGAVLCEKCLGPDDHECKEVPKTDHKISDIDRIVEGLQLIQKYDPKASTSAEHDVFYGTAEYLKVRALMTPEEAARMNVLGWLEHEGAWGTFT